MKKILAIIISLVLVMSLAGCKSGVSESPAEPTVAPAEQPNNTPVTEAPVSDTLPEDAGDFATSDSSFCWNESAELLNIVLGVFPIDDTKAVLQFAYYDATDDVEVPLELYYSFTCNLVNKATYRNADSDITVYINSDGDVNVSSANEAYSAIVGNYYSAGNPGTPDAATIVEYLRNVPAAGVGDFGSSSEDTIEESISGAWLHEVTLFRNGELFKTFLAADDMTGFCALQDEGWELVYGNMDSTLEQINYYDIELGEGEEESFDFVEMPIVFPYIFDGNELGVGETSFVDFSSPYELPYTFGVSSADESIVSVSDHVITAVAEGETELTISVDYAGTMKDYTIPVTVSVYDFGASLEDEGSTVPGSTLWFDTISQRATMEMTDANDIYTADIYWADGVDTTHHWCFVGEADPDDEFTINLVGMYVIENYDSEGVCTETVVDEEVYSALTFEDTGCLRWHNPSQEDLECLFEMAP